MQDNNYDAQETKLFEIQVIWVFWKISITSVIKMLAFYTLWKDQYRKWQYRIHFSSDIPCQYE